MKTRFKKNKINEIAKIILDKSLKIKTNEAVVLALSGELGAGKTTLTQEFAKHLGIKESIVSPTFVIMKIYNINNNSDYHLNFKKLIHIDAYRLDSSNELLKIGWREIIKSKDNLIIIEWPERVSDIIPSGIVNVKLNHIDEETREIIF